MEEKLVEILVQINRIIDVGDTKKTERIGVLDGLSGIALFKMEYGYFSNNEEVIDKACELLETCVDEINTDYYFPTFCSGIAGFSWTMSHLYQNNRIDFEIDEMLLQVDTYLYKNMLADFSNHNYDFLHGGIGYAIYFLERYRNTKYDAIRTQFKTTLIEVIDFLAVEVSEISNDNSTSNNKIDVGLSHGITSILAFLNQLAKETCFKSRVDKIIMRLAFYIDTLKSTKNHTSSFFPNGIEADKKMEYNSRLAWCYGDLGIAYTLVETACILNDNKLRESALQVLLHTVKRKKQEETLVDDPFICHGSFGNAHIYNSLFYLTNRSEFKEATLFWLNDGVERLNLLLKNEDLYVSKNELGIINGIAGIGLVIMSYLNPQNKNWDRILLLS